MVQASINISIHSLVKRETHEHNDGDYGDCISIHSLVKRETPLNVPNAVPASISIHSLVKRETIGWTDDGKQKYKFQSTPS